jgi:hypothetical protein
MSFYNTNSIQKESVDSSQFIYENARGSLLHSVETADIGDAAAREWFATNFVVANDPLAHKEPPEVCFSCCSVDSSTYKQQTHS